MQGHHRSASAANRLHGQFSVIGAQIAADDESAFSHERQGGFRDPCSAPGVRDDAHLPASLFDTVNPHLGAVTGFSSRNPRYGFAAAAHSRSWGRAGSIVDLNGGRHPGREDDARRHFVDMDAHRDALRHLADRLAAP